MPPPENASQRCLSGTKNRRRDQSPNDIHYTPPWLSRALVEVVFKTICPQKKDALDLLDPACGSGVFLIEAARELQKWPLVACKLRGIELSQIAGIMADFCTGKVANDLGSEIVSQSIQGGVDSLASVDWGEADAILMNPPFKAWKSLDERERATVKNILGALMVAARLEVGTQRQPP